jgi:Flp pilus assembly protein TadD
MHEAHSNLGLTLAARGRFDEAIPHYGDALRYRADYATAYFTLAIALANTARMDGARENGERARLLATRQNAAALAAQVAGWRHNARPARLSAGRALTARCGGRGRAAGRTPA